MTDNNNQLNFSNLNLADNQHKDNQKNYNPISGITKVESLEFDFEPDEDNDENHNYQESSSFEDNIIEDNDSDSDKMLEEQHNTVSDLIEITQDIENTILEDSVIDEDLLLIPEMPETDLIDNKTLTVGEESNIDYQQEERVVDDNDDDILNDNILTAKSEAAYFEFDNNFTIDTSFDEAFINDEENESLKIRETERIETNNVNNEDVENYVTQNIELENEINNLSQIEDVESFDILASTEELYDVDEQVIEVEENHEDILAEVLAQDYTVPIAGFEEFAERKRVREEAGKALDGESYHEFKFEETKENRTESLQANNLNTEEVNIEDEFIDDNLENDTSEGEVFESNIYNDDDELLEFNNQELDKLNNNDEELFELEEDEELEFSDIDITDIPDIGYEEDSNSIEELLNEESEVSEDNEFSEDFETNTIPENEEVISDNEIIDDAEKEVVSENDSEFDIFNNEESEDGMDFLSEDLDQEDDFFSGDITKHNDNGDFDDGGFQIGLGEEDSKSDEEDEFEDDDFGDGDFGDFGLDDLDDDSFGETDNGISEDSSTDYDEELPTNIVQEYFEKLVLFIRSLPALKQNIVQKIKVLFSLIKRIRYEIKEDGLRPTIKSYSIHLKNKGKDKLVSTKNKISKKIAEKKEISNAQNKGFLSRDSEKTSNEEWENNESADSWGMGPAGSPAQNTKTNSESEVKSDGNADWDDELLDEDDDDDVNFDEEFSFSTADMLMEDSELGLEEFDKPGRGNDNEEEIDTADYSGFTGKLKKLKKIVYRWMRLLYKYFDNIFDFEKNWWKIVDFVAVVVLTMSMAMVIAYYIWHK